MNSPDNSFVVKKSFRISLGVFLMVAILTQLLAYQQYRLKQEEDLRKVQHELHSVQSRLKKSLSYSLSATNTLAFIIENYGVPQDFDGIAKNILRSHQYIDVVELTQQGVITHVYPLKGNEVVLGFDILSDSITRKEALKAIEKNELFFAGPFKLRQGGIGIVGRVPIYLTGKFYGFSAVVIKLSTLMQSIGIDGVQKTFEYQFSKINPLTGKEEFFVGTADIRNRGTATASVEVPDGEWKLYVRLRSESLAYNSAWVFSLLGFILSFICAMYAHHWSAQPEKLKKLVDERTLALAASEENSRIMLERVSDAFIAFDRDMRCTYVNNKANEIFALPPGNFAGKEIEQKFSVIKETPLFSASTEAMATQEHACVQFYFAAADRWLECDVYPSQDGVSLFIRDVTERKQAEEAIMREKYLSDSIINSLPGIFYLYDSDRKFLRWNKNFENVTGYSYEEVTKMHPLDFYDESEKEMMRMKIESVFTTGQDDVETWLFTKDRKKIPYYFNGCRAQFNGKSYLIGMGIDIIKRKQVEQDALALIDDLQRKNNDLQQFSYIVSHNLRAPIAKIIGLINIMGDNQEQNKEYIKLIENEASNLDEIVKDINTIVSTRKANAERYEPVSFVKIVDQVKQVLETEIAASHANIFTDFSAIEGVKTLKSYLYSIVYNLISNAIKYRRPSVPLEIHVSAIPIGRFVCLEIRDNGRGIDLKKHESKLFGLYKRFHLEDAIPGRGVGLNLVKTQAESLGGSVAVESEVNVGSSFKIFIPVQYDTNERK